MSTNLIRKEHAKGTKLLVNLITSLCRRFTECYQQVAFTGFYHACTSFMYREESQVITFAKREAVLFYLGQL